MALGKLSARYESGPKGTAAVGYDSRGGASYGRYQIAEKVGTLKRFMEFLAEHDPELWSGLEAHERSAGDPRGQFAKEWKKIAADPVWAARLQKAEHDFIRETHYEPALDALDEDVQELVEASDALKEVLWSTAVQHGPAAARRIFSGDAAQGEDTGEIIALVYAQRRQMLSRLTEPVRQAVLKRYESEEKMALRMMEEGS